MYSCASTCAALAKSHAIASSPPIRCTAAATPTHMSHVPPTPFPCKPSYTQRSRHASIVYYTSTPERMGEQEENPSAGAPHSKSTEQNKANEARRQRDAAAQEEAMRVLQGLEAAAVSANPEAGHPEKRRMLSTVDYPAPEPAETPFNTPVSSWIQDTATGINAYISSSSPYEGEGPVGGRQDDAIDSPKPTAKAQDSIYDDNSQFLAWFEDP